MLDFAVLHLYKTELWLPSELELYHCYYSKLARKLGGDESEERQTSLAVSPPIHNATQMGDMQVSESETGINLRSQVLSFSRLLCEPFEFGPAWCKTSKNGCWRESSSLNAHQGQKNWAKAGAMKDMTQTPHHKLLECPNMKRWNFWKSFGIPGRWYITYWRSIRWWNF